MIKTLEEIAGLVGGTVDGDAGLEIDGICPLSGPEPGKIFFVEKNRDLEKIDPAARGIAALVPPDARAPGFSVVRADNPKLAFARVVALFHPVEKRPGGVHERAWVDPSARLGEGVYVGPFASVEEEAEIGDGSQIHSGCVVGKGARMGRDCTLYPNVTLYPGSQLGDRVTLHAGTVVGADGFGYVWDGERHVKLNQTGRAALEDDVEMGALSAADRAAMGETRIGAGTKIDNMVQIGHNVRIGRNGILCGQTGLSGSCSLGDNVVLAGQVGVADHVSIGDGVTVAGKGGVTEDLRGPGLFMGMPARPHREALRIFAAVRRLPELIRAVDRLTAGGKGPNGGEDGAAR